MAGKVRMRYLFNREKYTIEYSNNQYKIFHQAISLFSSSCIYSSLFAIRAFVIKRQRLSLYLVISIGFFSTTTGFSQEIRTKVNDGNVLYHEEKYEEALNSYQDALLEDPQSEIAHFNQGDALYKLNKYEKSIEAYQKVIGSEDLIRESNALYNIGNSYFKQDKLQESIDAYIKALDLNPNDIDAKYNLELARARLKEMAQKQQQQPQQSSKQQQGQEEQQQDQQGQDNEDQQGDQEQQSEAQEEQGEQSSGEEEQEEQQSEALEESKDEMTKEDAERILDALKNDEQDNQKLKKPARSRKRRVDKDW
jgi:tetratricopeptide (TPR) repeat protein